MEGDSQDKAEDWKRTTYIAQALGAHGKKSLQDVWRSYGLTDAPANKNKPSKAELEDRMKKAEEIYRRLEGK